MAPELNGGLNPPNWLTLFRLGWRDRAIFVSRIIVYGEVIDFHAA